MPKRRKKEEKMMDYHLKDQFILKGIECEVIYINHNMAWIAPLEDTILDGYKYYKHCAMDSLDPYGYATSGEKAVVISNVKCQAI